LINLLESGVQNLTAAEARPYLRLAQELRSKTADDKWMLDVISTLSDRQH